MMEFMMDGAFWVSVLQIIAIDILLGGDNAVVIALACRRLPEHQRNKGIAWGVFGAIALRIVLIFFALQLLELPFLKVVGALLLLWIGVKLMQPEDGDGHGNIEGSAHLLGAIKTIVVADAVMSLDNVIAVAGAAGGNMALVVFGIVVSIPIIVWGSKFVLKLMDRFPIVITLGAALLGWIAGGMLVGDVMVTPYIQDLPTWLHYLSSAVGALLVVAVGALLAKRPRVGAPRPERRQWSWRSTAPVFGRAKPSEALPKLKVLVPVDGSDNSNRALDHLRKLRASKGELDVHLLTVQIPVDSGHARMFVSAEDIDHYYREEGLSALTRPRQILDEAGIPYAYHIAVGNAAQSIIQYAADHGMDEIVMGTHGRGAMLTALLGSVASEVLKNASIPVTLVRPES